MTNDDAPATEVASARRRVLMVSTSYPRDLGDWRGVFIRHLAEALARRSDIALSVWAPPGPLPANVDAIVLPEESSWLATLMEAGGISHLMRHGGLPALLLPLRLLKMLADAYRRHSATDVYHVNWLQCALPLPANGKPAILTVLGNDLKLMRLPMVRTLLRRVIRGRRVAICPNAEWMQVELNATFGDIAQITPVPFGIDPEWYSIRPMAPPDAHKKWLAIVRLTRDKLGDLFEWSEPHFRDTGRELHLFGPKQEDIKIPGWVHYHGPATPAELARDWFPYAQGLITLSRHAEGRPQVMLEAMAAGLPIIASDTPAHADIVGPDTGRLCREPSQYAAAFAELEDPGIRDACASAARAWVAREIGTWDDCAARYVTIYNRLVEGDAHG